MGLTGDKEIGIYGLEDIFREVRQLDLDDHAARNELLRKVKLQNWIPEENEDEVKRAIFNAYKAFCRETE